MFVTLSIVVIVTATGLYDWLVELFSNFSPTKERKQ